MLRHVDAGVLDVAFEESGSSSGPAVLLLHGVYAGASESRKDGAAAGY